MQRVYLPKSEEMSSIDSDVLPTLVVIQRHYISNNYRSVALLINGRRLKERKTQGPHFVFGQVHESHFIRS